MPTPVAPAFPAVAHARRTLVWLVAACLAWAGVSWLASANLDGYNDMLENYAWAQPLRLGTRCGQAAFDKQLVNLHGCKAVVPTPRTSA